MESCELRPGERADVEKRFGAVGARGGWRQSWKLATGERREALG